MTTEPPIARTTPNLSPEEENLSKILQSRVRGFERFEGQENNDKAKPKDEDKKNFIEEFLEPYLANFTTLKQKWQGGEVEKNTEIVADFLGGKIDSMMEKYLPSSSQEKANVQKALTNLGVEDPNKIKLNKDENLIDQLKENRFNLEDLKKINNKINMTAIINPFSKDDQSIPIQLNGKEFRIDVKQYAEDLVAYNQLQKNTDANSRDSSQSQKIELSGILELYGKQKFNEKPSNEGAKIPLSDEEKQSIKDFQENANASDKKMEETLKKFAEKFGFTIPENKSQNTPEQPENKAFKIGQSTKTQRETIKPTTEKSPLKGILKKSPSPDSEKTPDHGKGDTWASRVTGQNASEKGPKGR